MARRAAGLLVGLTAISAGIRELKGVINNVYDRAQLVGVSIINHDLNGGNDGSPTGDCSKAKDLVNVLKTQEDKRNMVAWLAYFGNIGVKMENGTATEVRHFQADNKRYRQPDLDGAKANKWYEPYLPNGEKAHWFEGPAKPLYTPGTLGDIGDNVITFAERFLGTDRRIGQLYDKVDAGNGDKVNRYNLSDEEIQQAEALFNGVRKFGLMLMARERAEEYTAEVVKLNEFLDQATKVINDVNNIGENPTETTTEDVQEMVA
jgi:hypothetical protein